MTSSPSSQFTALHLQHALAYTAEPRFVSCTAPEVSKGTKLSPRFKGTCPLGQIRCIVCRSITDGFHRYFRRSPSTQRVLFGVKIYSRGTGALFRLPKASTSRQRRPSAYPPARAGASRTARAHARAGASPGHTASRRSRWHEHPSARRSHSVGSRDDLLFTAHEHVCGRPRRRLWRAVRRERLQGRLQHAEHGVDGPLSLATPSACARAGGREGEG